MVFVFLVAIVCYGTNDYSCQTCQPSTFDMVLRMGIPKEPGKARLLPMPG